MTTSPKLGIPFISGQQAQPEVTHNQAILLLQAVIGGAITLQNAPPGAPDDGDCYIVGTAGSGAWAGHNNQIAIYLGGWAFIPGLDSDGVIIPMGADQAGLSIFRVDLDTIVYWTGVVWAELTTGGGGGGSSGEDPSSGDYANALADLIDVDPTGWVDGYVLTYDAIAGKWKAEPSQGGGGSGGGLSSGDLEFGHVPTYQVITASGTYNRPDGVVQIKVRMVGGGGGGNGSGTGNTGGLGGAGGDTSFNSISAKGALQSTGTSPSTPGLGGTGGSGSATLRVPGSAGVQGIQITTATGFTNNILGGSGASSALGGGAAPANGIAGVAAAANTGSGGSGGGAAGLNISGGGGGSGEYVELIINNPASSYAVVIGAGGAAGAAGTSGVVGGAGGSGLILVEEIYSTAAAEGGLDLPQTSVITASGTYNTPAGATQLRIRIKGGGGGGSGSGSTFGNGANGVASSFNSIAAAPGSGGTNAAAGAGGSGGAGAALKRWRGEPGVPGTAFPTSSTNFGNVGGNGGGIGGGAGGVFGNAGGAGQANSGGGGGSGGTAQVAAATFFGYSIPNGGGEGEEVLLIIDNPASSYAAVIGTGGAGGTAGSGGQVGGDGGSGYVIVEALFSSGLIGYVPGQLQGTATNDDAAAGMVGEYISAERLSGAALALTSTNALDVISINLTAGDWDVDGVAWTLANAATVTASLLAWVSDASATIPTAPRNGMVQILPANTAGATFGVATGTWRFKLSAPTTIYLTIRTVFSVNTESAYGFIRARRVR